MIDSFRQRFTIKIKICGITSLEDAQYGAALGVDYLGFNFYSKSPRYIGPQKAGLIIESLPGSVKKVGIFVNASIDKIKTVILKTGIDFVQLHGEETPTDCNQITCPVIKAFRVRDDFSESVLNPYSVYAILLDAYDKNKRGGTGMILPWDKIPRIGETHKIFLAGGLNFDNIEEACQIVRPYAVDLNSGVENSPGIKNHSLMKKIVDKIRSLYAK